MICFVIALKSEAKSVAANMEGVAERTYCGKQIIEGRLCGEEVAVIVCGVGKVNAACGTQAAIDLFAPRAIINAGLAGGLNSSCELLGIYAISRAVQYDFDLSQINDTPIGTLNEFEERYLPLSVAGNLPTRALASGDRFNDSASDLALITQNMRADIREMEGAAIAQVCLHANVACYSFKCISDVAGSGSTTEQFLSNTQKCLEKMTAQIKNIFTEVLKSLER